MLDKIRNIIYDKNDIIVALCIILIAALVITNRMSAIFSYPEAQAQALAQQRDNQPAGSGSGTDVGDPGLTGNGTGEDGSSVQPPTPSGTPEYASIYVASGDTATTIAQNLAAAGFVESVEAFLAAVDAADAHTKLKAGEFEFVVGATPAEIVDTLTR